MRKIVFYGLLLIGKTIHAQKYRPIPDGQLSKMIVESVLNKYEPNKPIQIHTPNNEANIDYILKYHPSPFWETISSRFYLSDNWLIKNLLTNSFTIDSSLTYKSRVSYIIRQTKNAKSNQDKFSDRSRIINELFILFDKNRGICMVYFHAVSDGRSLAVLEKINGVWKLTSFKVETLE